jgi:hypothetical protein
MVEWEIKLLSIKIILLLIFKHLICRKKTLNNEVGV